MKKTYSRPEIVFEDFSMSTSITAGCEHKTNLPSDNECGIYFEGVGNVFLIGMTGCETFEVENGDFNGICYHVPYESNNLFTS